MGENEVPEWVLKAAQEADAYARQVAPILQAAQEVNEAVRLHLQLPRDVQAQIAEIRAAMAAVGPLSVPPQELTQVMTVGMRDLLAAYRRQSALVHGPTANVSVAAPARPVAVSSTDAVTATEDQAVAVQDSGGPAAQLDAKTVLLAILWVFAVLLPLKIGVLPPELQTIIRDYLTTVGLALIITWRVNDSRRDR